MYGRSQCRFVLLHTILARDVVGNDHREVSVRGVEKVIDVEPTLASL
jgi:hypothetical protein